MAWCKQKRAMNVNHWRLDVPWRKAEVLDVVLQQYCFETEAQNTLINHKY